MTEKYAFPSVVGMNRFPGMTMRQWYAGMALQGIISNSKELDACFDLDEDLKEAVPIGYEVVRRAFGFADVMIEEDKI